jgi:hypothetical protein
MTVDRQGLLTIASECVDLVEAEFGETLDWSVDSLETLDLVCDRLIASGPLSEDRRALWWKLVGAYVGEVVVRTYDGTWIEHEQAHGAFAVSALGVTAFPFSTTSHVLEGHSLKSLASLGRALPAVAAKRAP